MNQRLSRNSNNKNKTDFVSLSTGGFVARHVPNEDPQIQVPPQKVTGEIKPETPKGTAKASPNFKKVDSVEKVDEKKAIAENSQKVENDDKK